MQKDKLQVQLAKVTQKLKAAENKAVGVGDAGASDDCQKKLTEKENEVDQLQIDLANWYEQATKAQETVKELEAEIESSKNSNEN